MLKRILKFLSIIIIGLVCVGASYAETEEPGFALGNVGDYGTWATDENRDLLIESINHDIDNFAPEFDNTQLVSDYVPLEAKVGMAFINSMSHIANILDNSLGRFALIFILIMYTFWIMGEAYNNIQTGWDVNKLIKEILKKTFKVGLWVIVLSYGPAKMFMMLMTPIVMVGAYTADGILNTVSGVVGVSLPDTCSAIHNYAAAEISSVAIIDAHDAANIMCLPTRLSGFFTSGIALGWKCIKDSIGESFSLFFLGLAFIILFIGNSWKFLFMAFGVIADLFLAIIMLPFTAIAETVTKTSYNGIAGNVYNAFVGLFKAESLKEQIGRVVAATIYFLVLGVIIAVCVALMSGVVNLENGSFAQSISDISFMPLLITGCLVWYLTGKADEIAKEWGGSIKDELGTKLRESVNTLGKDIYKGYKDIRKAFKKD